MGFQVVCISRTIGAGGEYVGQMVAQRLGFRYVDEQIITRAAQLAQVDPKLVADIEHQRPLLQRLIDRLAAAADLVGPVSLATGLPLDAFAPGSSGYRASPEDLRVLIRVAIHEVASGGRAVIVAHAASRALAGTEGVLRVFVTGSPELRARRLASAQGIGAADAATAVATSDRERRDYLQRFYATKEELPTHYDIVVNTDAFAPEQVAAIILSVAQSGE
jgi:cytidylate kinase